MEGRKEESENENENGWTTGDVGKGGPMSQQLNRQRLVFPLLRATPKGNEVLANSPMAKRKRCPVRVSQGFLSTSTH